MFKDDWDALGIARTADLPSIKKAYALRLRVTRPDDDAVAYQRLRQAYERVQQWARSAQHAEPPLEVIAIEGFEPLPETVQPRPAELPIESETEPAIGSIELAAWVTRLVPQRLADKAELHQAWSEIRQLLLTVPLHLQAEASARFADLVIQQSGLPTEIVEDLQKHFGWLDDFRAARLLGPGRLQALHATLEDRIVRPITNPDVLHHFAPLIYLHRLGQQGRRWKATWFATQLGAPLAELENSLDPRSRRRLGLATDARSVAESALTWAMMSRYAAMVLIIELMLLPRLMLTHDVDRGVLLIGPPFAAMGLWLLKLAATFICSVSRMSLEVNPQLAQRWHRFREHWHCAALGLVLLAGVALFNSLATDGMPIVYGLLPWLVGLLLAWPRNLAYGIVVLACMLFLMQVFMLPPFATDDHSVMLGWVPVWVLGGLLIHLQGKEIPLLPVFFRPLTNALTLCDRYGYKLALAPMVVAAVVPLAVDGTRASTVFVCWALANMAFSALQGWLTKSAQAGMDAR